MYQMPVEWFWVDGVNTNIFLMAKGCVETRNPNATSMEDTMALSSYPLRTLEVPKASTSPDPLATSILTKHLEEGLLLGIGYQFELAPYGGLPKSPPWNQAHGSPFSNANMAVNSRARGKLPSDRTGIAQGNGSLGVHINGEARFNNCCGVISILNSLCEITETSIIGNWRATSQASNAVNQATSAIAIDNLQFRKWLYEISKSNLTVAERLERFGWELPRLERL